MTISVCCHLNYLDPFLKKRTLVPDMTPEPLYTGKRRLFLIYGYADVKPNSS